MALIIGLTGTLGAGKGTTAQFLMDNYGFVYHSCSDVLREELAKQGKQENVDTLSALGNEIRAKYGANELAKRLLKKIKESKEKFSIVDSLRSVGEIEEVKKAGGIIFALDAPIELRYSRIQKRKRKGDDVSFEKFQEQEAKQLAGTGPKMNLRACMALADHTLTNEGKFEDLYSKISKIVNRLEVKKMGDTFKRKIRPRIGWDDYFMKIALLVAERSTCRRHHVGAVAVKEKRILTTGYNGAPANTKDCIELGCLRDELNIPSGTRHEACRAVHAEQNVIIQAGLHGVNVEGATVYCTHSPCILCAKILVNARIKKFVTCGSYPDTAALELLKEAGVEFEKRDKPEAVINVLE
ncbi:tRNA-specific adenosine deaminase [Candidatus Gugararchaeum adminiculabundum]|nr:tRNA-specific adenosine deaminase [Candidatus Gugararchaeum adminiculabundum]